MTATLNASTSSGVILTSDTSGTLAIQSNGTTIMTVGSTGVSTQVGAPAFSAYPSVNQAISQDTYTKVTFDVEEFDTNNNFASSRFTPTVAGYYFVELCVYGNASSGQDPSYNNNVIYKNGTAYKSSSSNCVGSARFVGSSQVSTIMYLNGTTDYIEGYVRMGNMTGSPQVVGGTVAVNSIGTPTHFSAALIRSA